MMLLAKLGRNVQLKKAEAIYIYNKAWQLLGHVVFTEARFVLEDHSFAQAYSEPNSPPSPPPLWEDSLAAGKLHVNGRCVWGMVIKQEP